MNADVPPGKSGDLKETRAEKAIRLLTTAPGSPFKQKLAEFEVFYPAVVAAKKNDFNKKQILKILAEGGLKLYPALLEKLMTAMKRSKPVHMCPTCGQSLDSKATEAVGESTQIECVSTDANGGATSAGDLP